jgi:hypothetical protein
MQGWILLQQLNVYSPSGNALIQAVNQGKVDAVREYEGMIKEWVTAKETNAAALTKMEKLNLDAIPIVDDVSGKVLGIAERGRILSRMFISMSSKSGR